MASASARNLPYRPCVGLTLFNRAGLVFIGRRATQGPDQGAYSWQMPQGGIDEGEDPLAAARRELFEETSIRTVRLLGEAPEWYAYDLPEAMLARSWRGRYRGQTQKWFAFRFEGDESEIDVATPGGGAHKAEFAEWRWAPLAELPGLIVPFKRGVYERVVEDFAPFALPG